MAVVKEIYKNDEIDSDDFTDLAGDTMTPFYGGELRLGDTAGWESHQAKNLDGTLTAMPAEDEVISVAIVCSCCGTPVRSKKDLTKVGTSYRCKDCIDEER